MDSDLHPRSHLFVSVRSRLGVVFEGELASVSSYNTRGLFDILPEHTNFVSMITNKLILRNREGKQQEINVDKGMLVVEQNRVQVFIGVGNI